MINGGDHMLPAFFCDDPQENRLLLRADGTYIKIPTEDTDLLPIKTRPFFSTPGSTADIIAFLEPFIDRIDWEKTALAGIQISWLPDWFWKKVDRHTVITLLSRIESIKETYDVLQALEIMGVDLADNIVKAPFEWPDIHGPREGTKLEVDDSIAVFPGSDATIRMPAERPLVLKRKLFRDHIPVIEGQPLYIVE
jgi:hypothetical protein